MKKSLFFVVAGALALLATSCNKPLQQPENVTCNPNPLVVVGNTIDATVTGTFPAKEFNKKGVLVVTPVLKYNGQEAVGKSRTFVGEKAKVSGTKVPYKTGGTYSIKAEFDYVPEMAVSELYLRFEASAGKKTYDVPELKVADGVITTSKLVAATADEMQPQLATDKFQRIIEQKQEADIKFLIQQSNLRNEAMGDLKNLTGAAVKAAKDGQEIKGLEISGYASPDGGLELNTNLAKQRQANTANYVARELRRNKVKLDVDTKVVNEDWEGFQALMEKSNIKDKQLVLRVLSMYTDPEEREAQIKNLAAVYETIADEILPQLRRSRMTLTTDLLGRTDDEILAALDEQPCPLSYEELLYATSLLPDGAKKKAVYEQAIAVDPNDYRAYNNLAIAQYKENDINNAAANIAKALRLAPQDANVNYNAGVIALAQGDTKKAAEYFGKAGDSTGDVNAALGTMYTINGDYKNAQKAYGAAKTNNAAIQQILNEDYAAASATLNAVQTPNATTYYLKAVVGARTNDRQSVYSNLRTAIAKDASMKAKAAKDIEFAKFAEDASFLELVR